MSAKRQLRRRSTEDEPRFVIGMDAHSKKLAISIWDWSDRFNPCLHREIKCMDIEAMVATYERHVDLDSITIIEASTNSANLRRMLNEAGYRAEVVRSARRVARARIQTQYWGVAPAPIRGARSPEPQTRGRIRPRYPRLCSTNASEKDFSHFPLDASTYLTLRTNSRAQT